MTAYCMSGAAGRMGRTIISCQQQAGLSLAGALEREGSEFLGQDAGSLAGIGALGISVVAEPNKALKGAASVIDFSSPENTLNLAQACAEQGVGLVVGTTGFSAQQRKDLESFAAKIPLLISPNMSTGVNVLFHLTRMAAKVLGKDYAAEVTEIHHRHKKDAPSGTAVKLLEIIEQEFGLTSEHVAHGRSGLTGARPSDEIGSHALRGGDVVGDHTVFFLGEGERIEITHRASSRNTFAMGALRAAAWLDGQKPGLYTMDDVLGLG
ncbi:MAG: 4-hydroxy-tetrahydrodipicolinate reductase [Leptospiraceae bacterium]|nr:4-hydroxy-tetrahydrodipicolinate reductase [Leptospiraceae bacterium]